MTKKHGVRIPAGACTSQGIDERHQRAASRVVGLVDVQVDLQAVRLGIAKERIEGGRNSGKAQQLIRNTKVQKANKYFDGVE